MIERAAYPLDEAGRLLGGISRGTFYNMKARGEIRFVKIGRRSMIPADEIRRLVGETAPAATTGETNDTIDEPSTIV